MEPTTLALAGIAVLMAKKSAETVSEVVTKEALEATLPALKAVAGQLAAPLRDRVAALGDRVAARLPTASQENPFEDLALLEAIVVEEAADPAVAATVDEVVAAVAPIMPAITIENWKGINVKGGQNTISGNTLNF
ncbi:MAG: hypothetical protein BJG00_019010 [Limnothrix sp. CACIAM 69d]|nr:MAG: hypothetical protein BJG00_019010 [Limnothrix sp. CACIAM 69d]